MKNPCAAVLAGVMAFGAAGLAVGQVVTRDLYYTRYQLVVPTEKNVKRVTVSYNRTTHALVLSNISDVASTSGADGIVFHPDGDLLVGGQATGLMFKINRNTGSFTSQPVGQTGAFHVKIDPLQQKAWTAGLPGTLAEVPINPFGPGTSHAILGDETAITDLAFAAGKTFYTASGPGGDGTFGTINLNTFVTSRVLDHKDYAHGMQYDPFSGHLILCGEHQIAQIDPSTTPPTVVSVADFSALFPTLDLDQCAVDGTGLIYAASNNGRLLVMDYAATHLVGSSMATASVEFVELFLDDIAPLIGPGVNPCCEIGTGAFDQQNGQQSQLPGLPGGTFDYRVADDFYLSPDRIYRINSIEATMITDSTIPKAVMELYQDCNGFPADPPFLIVANATAITPTGGNFGGKPVYRVRFDFTDLWLKGGKSYWVSFIGRGLGSNTEAWFWGTAGFGFTVSGTPGAFKSASAGIPAWKRLTGSTAGCPGCLGCTDFAFCVNASACKILHDNGTYSNTGALSLDGPAGFTVQRVADDVVIPPCSGAILCYLEAYVATNCPSVGLSIYDNLCRLPASTTPRATLTPSRIFNTGQTTTINGLTLPILCLQFWNIGLTLPPGRNYWVSAFGVGDGTATQVAYFLHNQDCARPCLQKWNEGALFGAANAQPAWVKGSTVFGAPKDFAFLVAIVDPSPPFGGPGDPGPACAADFNNNGTLNVEDIFAFLTEWFAGCI